jgi:predicted ATPase
MLESITVKNYKAFDEAVIPIKPITILLGANSVGKSSLTQILLMLQQTGRVGLKSYKSALKLYGGYVNLGDAKNLFRKTDTTKPLKISFLVRSTRLKEFLKTDFREYFSRIFFDLPYYLPLKGFSEIRRKPIEKEEDFEKYIDRILDILSKENIQDKYLNEINFVLKNRHDLYLPSLNSGNKRQFIEAYNFLFSLSKVIRNDTFTISYELGYNENILITNCIEIYHGKHNILSLNLNANPNPIVTSSIFKLTQNDSNEILSLFEPTNTIFNTFKDLREQGDNIFSPKTSIVVQLFNYVQNDLKHEFSDDNINYVSPLRAHPKRYYMLDKAKLNLTLDTLDGDAIAEVLKDDSVLKTKVNNWLKKFGVQVSVEEFKEVINHLKVKQNNLNLDITDVGFGISQILPVIIQGFLTSDNSTTIIEQPEIHLHPKMQADLADLFIDIVKNASTKKLIIETHSEYLLKRLRRRISEGKIDPNKVAICLIDPQNDSMGAKINELKIENKGFFEWPIDFYGGELLADTTEFLKNQNS